MLLPYNLYSGILTKAFSLLLFYWHPFIVTRQMVVNITQSIRRKTACIFTYQSMPLFWRIPENCTLKPRKPMPED